MTVHVAGADIDGLELLGIGSDAAIGIAIGGKAVSIDGRSETIRIKAVHDGVAAQFDQPICRNCFAENARGIGGGHYYQSGNVFVFF